MEKVWKTQQGLSLIAGNCEGSKLKKTEPIRALVRKANDYFLLQKNLEDERKHKKWKIINLLSRMESAALWPMLSNLFFTGNMAIIKTKSKVRLIKYLTEI